MLLNVFSIIKVYDSKTLEKTDWVGQITVSEILEK